MAFIRIFWRSPLAEGAIIVRVPHEIARAVDRLYRSSAKSGALSLRPRRGRQNPTLECHHMHPPPLPDKDAEHIKLLTIFHYVTGGLALIGIGFLVLHFYMMKAVFDNPQMWENAKN